MRTLVRDAAHDVWDQYWEEMNHSWFKLEVLPDYSGENHVPSYSLWMEGWYEKSIEALKAPDVKWRQKCQTKVAQGVHLQRIRILETPQTFYTQWELQHFRYVNIPGGEQVSIIPREQAINWPLPSGDVTIFDGMRAVQWAYRSGRMTHGMFYEGPEDRTRLIELLRLQQSLLSIAQPLAFS
jgi:hypothetical protein